MILLTQNDSRIWIFMCGKIKISNITKFVVFISFRTLSESAFKYKKFWTKVQLGVTFSAQVAHFNNNS